MNRRILTFWTGTPTLRAALASPPTAKIQLPNRVRESTQVASSVMPSHQRTLMRKLCGAQNVLAKMCSALSAPGTSDRPATRTVPVISFVKPRLTPWRMKNVARVTMKLGSFVFMTM